jgi:hypothetical protein
VVRAVSLFSLHFWNLLHFSANRLINSNAGINPRSASEKTRICQKTWIIRRGTKAKDLLIGRFSIILLL